MSDAPNLRWPLAVLAIGAVCIAVAFAMPVPRSPRLDWTDQKSVHLQESQREVHSLSHALIDAAGHSSDPSHVHTVTESNDPLLTALELEKAQARSAELQTQLEAARQTPAGWNLLLGVIGFLFVVVGSVLIIASKAKT